MKGELHGERSLFIIENMARFRVGMKIERDRLYPVNAPAQLCIARTGKSTST
jgi:hypothetical protein